MSQFQSQAQAIQQIWREIQMLKARFGSIVQQDGNLRQDGTATRRAGVMQTHDHLGTGEGGLIATKPTTGRGFLHKLASSHEYIQSKLDATAAPGVTDDSDSGYAVGSIWIDVTNDRAYVCVDASVGAAEWGVIASKSNFGATAIPDQNEDET
ncbi:MAG: hypothetical protein IID37_06035, partial [Planctomycetes bacterium]|nr:hypothetical protein [Planctomycetota bacterium]